MPRTGLQDRAATSGSESAHGHCGAWGDREASPVTVRGTRGVSSPTISWALCIPDAGAAFCSDAPSTDESDSGGSISPRAGCAVRRVGPPPSFPGPGKLGSGHGLGFWRPRVAATSGQWPITPPHPASALRLLLTAHALPLRGSHFGATERFSSFSEDTVSASCSSMTEGRKHGENQPLFPNPPTHSSRVKT